jgi:hypothetical protein
MYEAKSESDEFYNGVDEKCGETGTPGHRKYVPAFAWCEEYRGKKQQCADPIQKSQP